MDSPPEARGRVVLPLAARIVICRAVSPDGYADEDGVGTRAELFASLPGRGNTGNGFDSLTGHSIILCFAATG
jgi:hypothetical protein